MPPPWQSQYDSLSADLRIAQRDLDEVSADRSPAADRQRAAAQRTVIGYDSRLKELAREAKAAADPAERERRLGLVEELRARRQVLISAVGPSRAGAAGPAGAIRRAFGGGADPEAPAAGPPPPLNFDHMSDHQLLEHQEREMKEQDAALERLHGTLLRQHKVGVAIGDELTQQRGLLQELDDGVTRNQAAIQSQTQRLKEILGRKKDSRLTCLIFVLALIFFVLLVAAIAT
eukprot:TRINITY_DN18537_c0_g1_i2.p1 TRINITY_DN18537_c0_g1~~TRINITY_DN18537_c0_g1_i2.p1  ORF type:complete len:259 (+),score=97.99 TRINITY_DN18537_c0_g1_i2:83-778(+)